MSENNIGLRSILTHPRFYLWFQWLVGTQKLLKALVDDYIKPTPELRLLDIGCGPGTLHYFIPPVHYQGFDMNESYIDYALKKFGSRPNCHFYCKKVTEEEMGNEEKFDVVLAVGLLHHLDDEEADYLCKLAKSLLKPGGRFLTADCCLTEPQSKIARFIVSNDRGQNVRSPEGYKKIASAVFPKVKMEVRHDLMHIPYTHTIMEMH